MIDSPIHLRCLNGAPPPQQVVEGWQVVRDFSDSVRQAFWNVLGLIVAQPADSANDDRVQDFCKTYDLPHERALLAMSACDFLLGSGVAQDLGDEEVYSDVLVLVDGDKNLAGEFRQRYALAKPELRRRVVEATLADHGALFAGLDWRVDHVTGSDRGVDLEASVVFLTLRYREGEDEKRLTLQLTPDAIRELREFTSRFEDSR
jgi:hypothetical protein